MSSQRQTIVIPFLKLKEAETAIRTIMGFKEKNPLFGKSEIQDKLTTSKSLYPKCQYTLNTNAKNWAAIQKALPYAEIIFGDERAKAFDGRGTRTPVRHKDSPRRPEVARKAFAEKFNRKIVAVDEDIVSVATK